jgi:hypothetical protein
MIICPPALIYLGFALAQVVLDLMQHSYNKALSKFVVMTIFTFILNQLCVQNMSIIAWVLVFLPFIFMSFISSMMLMAFNMPGIKQPPPPHNIPQTHYYN